MPNINLWKSCQLFQNSIVRFKKACSTGQPILLLLHQVSLVPRPFSRRKNHCEQSHHGMPQWRRYSSCSRCRPVKGNVPLWGSVSVAKYPDMQLLAKVCMAVLQLLSDGQIATRYAPCCMFETCKQEQSVWHRRRRDSFVEGQIGGSKFELAMATGGRSGGVSMRY